MGIQYTTLSKVTWWIIIAVGALENSITITMFYCR